LVSALVFALLAASLFVVGYQLTHAALQQGRNTKASAQVYNVALAGITHAANWLQRQPSPPVTCFDPKSNANSPDDDQETSAAEEQLGLVNEFVVDARSNLWGRYEVGRSTTGPVPAPARGGLVTQTGSHSPLYAGSPMWTAEDVSKQRGETVGTVWRVRSRAYIFMRPTPGAPFALSGPTKPIQTITLEADIRRGRFNYHQAAIYNYAPDNTPPDVNGFVLDIHAHDAIGNTVVQALDGSGYIWWTRTTNIGTGMYNGFAIAGPTLSGANDPTSAAYVADGLTDQLSFYFAVPDTATLKGMADAYYEDEPSIPQPVNAKPQLVYIKPSSGTVQFGGGGHPNLSGGGVLFVEGNLNIDGTGTNQSWDGLIFVTGDYDQTRGSTITGGLVCGTHFRIHGYHNDVSKVLYSPSTLDSINAQIGSYRVMRSTVRAVDDATAKKY
jgi:hypothetical protein